MRLIENLGTILAFVKQLLSLLICILLFIVILDRHIEGLALATLAALTRLSLPYATVELATGDLLEGPLYL